MRVRVKDTLPITFYGFYHKRLRPGEEFELKDIEVDGEVTVKAEDQFSKVWMEIVEAPKRGPGRPPKSETSTLEL